MLNQGTIIAKATGAGSSAISLFRLSGSDAIRMVSKCFQPKSEKKLADQKSHTVHLGTLHDKESLDEVLVSIFSSSLYTGEMWLKFLPQIQLYQEEFYGFLFR